jgi:hypothetical protein
MFSRSLATVSCSFLLFFRSTTPRRRPECWEDGSYKQVFEGLITPSTPWLRYVYSKFEFAPVNDPGLYVIEYADQRTASFPISKDAYANIWQDSLDHHLAAQMDHVSVREGYRVWHGASHLDDGRMAPVVGEQFDGWNQATATDGKWKGGDRIPGMNVLTRSSASTRRRAITPVSRTIAGSSLRTIRFFSGMPLLRWLQLRIR